MFYLLLCAAGTLYLSRKLWTSSSASATTVAPSRCAELLPCGNNRKTAFLETASVVVAVLSVIGIIVLNGFRYWQKTLHSWKIVAGSQPWLAAVLCICLWFGMKQAPQKRRWVRHAVFVIHGSELSYTDLPVCVGDAESMCE